MKILQSIWTWISLNIISPITWNPIKALFNGGVYWDLTEEDHNQLRKLLAKNHYIILVYRKTHFTSYLIMLGNLIKTGKMGSWSHALMNLEGEAAKDEDFRLLEATGKGVHYSSFMQVFDCDRVCLLRPKGFTDEDWTEALDKLRKQEGKPYDTLFDLSEDQSLSCVELVHEAIEGDLTKLPSFTALIEKYKNLTPQMFYDCDDFEKVFEVRR